MFEPCTEVVTILTALIFGADGACVDISMRSVGPALIAFVVAVVVLKVVGHRLLTRLVFRSPPVDPAPTPPRDLLDGPQEDGGPIRTLR